jgi:hypothetical protein
MTLKSWFRFRTNPMLGIWAPDVSDLPMVGYPLELLQDRSPFEATIRMRRLSSANFPQALALISGYSSDESRLGDDADEDELDALVNVWRVDITIGISQMSLAVRMYNPVNRSKPEQVLPDLDEGARVGCCDTGPGVSVLPNDKHQRPKGKLGVERELHIESPRCHGLSRRILSASPFLMCLC